MDKFEIIGGAQLSGEIRTSGAKNSALKILAASLLADGQSSIENVPMIEDIRRMFEILRELGAKVEVDEKNHQATVDATSANKTSFNPELSRRLRASIILAGPILARQGKVKMAHPGGCVIGQRPVDEFMDGFEKFGAKITESPEGFFLEAPRGGLKGAEIFFTKVTVTGTETMLMAAVLAKGKTVLQNCAMEPEVVSLADYLCAMGAKIRGAGTAIIEIEGVEKLSGASHPVIPDRIEAGTFLMMGLLTGSAIRITHCTPSHLGAVLPVLKKTGAKFKIGPDSIETFKNEKLKAVSVKTHEYPGFATDLQSPYVLLMTQSRGMSIVHETIFESRLFFTDQLVAMGADIIMCDPHRVVINGPRKLTGKKLVSPDLRAGITMLLAGMIAQGKTVIENIYQIDRGYENIEGRLKKLGAKIKRLKG